MMGEHRLNSRFPLKEEAVQTDCFFLLCKMKTRTKRPHSPLPGVGGVNTTREQIAHPVGSSLVFRSKKKQSKWAAFFVIYAC